MLVQERRGLGMEPLPVDGDDAEPASIGSRPRKMFSPIDSDGTSDSSWWTVTMPAARRRRL